MKFNVNIEGKNFFIIAMFFVVFFLGGCSQKEPILPSSVPIEVPKEIDKKEIDDMPIRKEIVKSALKHLGKKTGGDCSGFVDYINKENNQIYYESREILKYFEDSRKSLAIFNLLEQEERIKNKENPKIGDLIFFSNTLKSKIKNKDLENITHIGIVTSIDDDFTVNFIHHASGKVKIDHMNIEQKNEFMMEDKIVNSYMTKCSVGQQKSTCLTSAKFAGFGKIKEQN